MASTLLEGQTRSARESPAGPRPVFLGGSGQSGVSTVNLLLGGHPRVLTCHLETSFVIAPHGVMDVVNAISTDYLPYRLDVTLHEFDRLMHHHLCSPRSYPYSGFDLAAYFGRDRYHAAVEAYLSNLGVVRHPGDGMTIQSWARVGRVNSPFKLGGLRLPPRLARERTYLYHATRLERDRAMMLARGFIDALFGQKAREEGKLAWCDQTTNNQQYADFLLALFPEGLYVNLTRDPLDVAIAHYSQPWAIHDFTRICESLRDLYGRWFEVRKRLHDSSFVDVRFEDVVSDPEAALSAVCAAIGLDTGFDIAGRRPDGARLERGRSRRGDVDLRTYREVLGEIAEKLGYRVP